MRSPILTAAAVTAALFAVGAGAAAASTRAVTAQLGWTEYAPLCNTIANVGVPNCGPDPYPAVFRLRVSTLRVVGDRWSLAVAITNLSRVALSFSGRFELCALPEVTTTETNCRPASASAPRLRRVAAGASWRATESGEAPIASGSWIRVLLPGVMGSFDSPTGGVIAWLTVHAYHFIAGGHSVARYNGTG